MFKYDGYTMRSHISAAFATSLVLVSVSFSAAGAEFLLEKGHHNLSGEPSADVTLFGDISIGDAEKLEALIAGQNDSGVVVSGIRLLSPGGVLNEGLALGRIIRKYRLLSIGLSPRDGGLYCYGIPGYPEYEMISQVDDPDCDCASSCALAWLGGIRRLDAVAFHRAYMPDPDDRSSFSSHENALDAASEEIRRYLTEVRAPTCVLDRILATPSAKLYVPTDEEREELFIDPLFEEFVIARCGQDASTAERHILSLYGKGFEPPVSPDIWNEWIRDDASGLCQDLAHEEARAEVQYKRVDP